MSFLSGLSVVFKGVKSALVETKESVLEDLESRFEELNRCSELGKTYQTSSRMEECATEIRQLFTKIETERRKYERGDGGSSRKKLDELSDKIDGLIEKLGSMKISVDRKAAAENSKGVVAQPIVPQLMPQPVEAHPIVLQLMPQPELMPQPVVAQPIVLQLIPQPVQLDPFHGQAHPMSFLPQQALESLKDYKDVIDEGAQFLVAINKQIGNLSVQDINKIQTLTRSCFDNLQSIGKDLSNNEFKKREIAKLRANIKRISSDQNLTRYPACCSALVVMTSRLKQLLQAPAVSPKDEEKE